MKHNCMRTEQTVASDDVGSLGEGGQLAIWRSPQAPGCVSGVLDPAFGGHHEVQQSRQIGNPFSHQFIPCLQISHSVSGLVLGTEGTDG